MSGLKSKLYKIIHPTKAIYDLGHLGLLNWIPDELYCRMVFQGVFGYKLDLEKPQSFNEKIQWLKLNDRKDIYTTMVDKDAVKSYVGQIIGTDYVIPTIGIWEKPEQIDFQKLPDQFVLKCTHDSGSIVICHDKRTFDYQSAEKKLRYFLGKNSYWSGREWPYKNVPPRIIAEPYLKDSEAKEIIDYKVHCFNGEPRVVLVCQDRFSENGMTEDFFDTSWNHLNVRRAEHGNAEKSIQRPEKLDEMLKLSRLLSGNIPFLRVDFYVIDGNVYFGELTFYPASGLQKFIPETFDLRMGEWISLR